MVVMRKMRASCGLTCSVIGLKPVLDAMARG
jgi:hypothetical protein